VIQHTASQRNATAPPVPSVVTSKLNAELVACTRKVSSLSVRCDLHTAAFFQLRGHFASSGLAWLTS
jgi:hypothetical protein